MEGGVGVAAGEAKFYDYDAAVQMGPDEDRHERCNEGGALMRYAVLKGEEDLRDMVRAMKTMATRRFSPAWSPPLQVWLLMAEAAYYSRRNAQPGGLGYEVEGGGSESRRRLARRLGHVRQSQRCPQAAHLSEAVTLEKGNGILGTKGCRVIHMLCPLWKTW